MRKIKFRGKRKDGKGWITGIPYAIESEDATFIIDNCQSLHLSDGDTTFTGKRVIPETVGQFTGLTDKNGKEIYEGDIVLFTWFSYGEYELETEYQGYIDFLNGSFLFCCEHGNYPLSELEFDSESDIEVIGNIHDNPDLLTQTILSFKRQPLDF